MVYLIPWSRSEMHIMIMAFLCMRVHRFYIYILYMYIQGIIVLLKNKTLEPELHNTPHWKRNVHISDSKWYIVGCGTGALWDLSNLFIVKMKSVIKSKRGYRFSQVQSHRPQTARFHLLAVPLETNAHAHGSTLIPRALEFWRVTHVTLFR